jgi:hypothetical protein
MANIKFGNKTIDLPRSRVLRVLIGCGLIVFGVLGFLPILGFWMIPLGLLVLSVDIPTVRRARRKAVVRVGQWLKRHYPALAERLGFRNGESAPI